MSRLLVLGATGRVGGHVVDLALEHGHRVTAFVRSPARIKRDGLKLSVIQGTPLSSDDLAKALPGHDAVVSALGLPAREALRRSTFMAESAASTVAAMTTAGVNRLAIVSAAVLFPDDRLRFRFFQWMLREHARDLLAMEAVVQATPLEWTIARPPRLVDRADASFRARDGALPAGAWSMSFRGVAAFLLECVEKGRPRGIVGLGAGGVA